MGTQAYIYAKSDDYSVLHLADALGPPMGEWLAIEHCPKDRRQMFVVIAKDVPNMGSGPYTTDPYCVWVDDGEFKRWPHPFPPTHFLLIPKV